MLGRIVKRDCPIVVHTALRDVSRIKQGIAHVAMPDHKRNRGVLFLRKREEIGREIETDIAIECQSVRGPEAVEDKNDSSGSSEGSLSASACSISRRACSTAALVSGAAYPLT